MPTTISSISDEERDFIRSWCYHRNLDDIYSIRSILYWIRIRDKISYSWVLGKEKKNLYMILCIHISLKFDGYDELFSCNFLRDLREIYPMLDPSSHSNMEFEILSHLQWDLGL